VPAARAHDGGMTTTQARPEGRYWRFARVTAPTARRLAGRRFFPLWAVVHHRGRRTGRELSVPIAVRVSPDRFVVALPWGPDTNWARNVLAAGGCVVRWRGADHRVTRAELVGRPEARPYYGGLVWLVAEHVIHADTFLILHRDT
jgi:deazaflavin-dependent oxidoreductase (nitroreductase family)